MSRLKLLSLVSLILLAVFLLAGTIWAEEPPSESEEIDINDPEVVERLRAELVDAILAGDGRPVWDELTPEARSVVADAVVATI